MSVSNPVLLLSMAYILVVGLVPLCPEVVSGQIVSICGHQQNLELSVGGAGWWCWQWRHNTGSRGVRGSGGIIQGAEESVSVAAYREQRSPWQ